MIDRYAAAREQVAAQVVPGLLEAFADRVMFLEPTNDQIPQVYAAPEAIVAIAKWLKERGFHMLVDMGGVDYYPKRDPRFEVVYHFRALPTLGMIRVRVRCTEKEPVPTLSEMYLMADPAEREIYDQFGIKFTGHPNLTRILNPDDWEGHPLRKDYPIRGPRALIHLEMPADMNRYPAFVDEQADNEKDAGNGKEG
jgi:NADH-quinone oxidoreductase subunit C